MAPFDYFCAFELQVACGSYRAPAVANHTDKGGVCPINTGLKTCLPCLLSCYSHETWICALAPLGLLPFTCPLRGLERITCSGWNRPHSLERKHKYPRLHGSQGALSLGLIQERPMKLRSLWDYWKHNLHQHFQPEIFTAQAGVNHSCASGIYDQKCGTRSPKRRAMDISWVGAYSRKNKEENQDNDT